MSGLTYIYTRADSPAENIDLKGIAREIDFETNSAINNAVIKGLDDDIITSRIRDIGDYYLDRYPFMDLILVYGDNEKEYIVWTGSKVDMCHIQGNDRIDKEVERDAIGGHLEHGDNFGKCNSQNDACPPEVIRCEDELMIDKNMEIDFENNKNIIEIFTLFGEKIELKMGDERELYVILSNVQGEEKNFVIV